MPGARLALLAASGVLLIGGAAAQAADLGGNCCADLEERIAELEANTARKGNRKVSLTVSGWVNEAVFFWDDGVEQNAYVGTNSLEQTRFQFVGEAKIDNDWSAGYRLELGINGAASNGFSQDNPGTGNSVAVRQSHWYLKSKTFGKLSVGLTGTATYHLLDDADATNTRNYSDAEAAPVALGAFAIRSNGLPVSGLLWKDLLQGVQNDTPGQNGRRNIVRYDSPELASFVATASWGEDDMWGVALTYKGDLADFKVVGKIGYEHNTDSNTAACNSKAAELDCQWWGAAGTILHQPTGLYVYGGYGEQNDDSEENFSPTADGTDTVWFVQGGIEQKWVPLGKTTIFGEFRHDDAGTNIGKTQSADIDHWAGGVVQNIENAAMDLYMIYRHSEGDFVDAGGNSIDLDDFDMVITGARIQF
jgi:predicted porin